MGLGRNALVYYCDGKIYQDLYKRSVRGRSGVGQGSVRGRSGVGQGSVRGCTRCVNDDLMVCQGSVRGVRGVRGRFDS